MHTGKFVDLRHQTEIKNADKGDSLKSHLDPPNVLYIALG